MIIKSKCFKCKKTPRTTKISELTFYYTFNSICLCETCLEVIVNDWLDQELDDDINDNAIKLKETK